jgi:hypothetical protein
MGWLEFRAPSYEPRRGFFYSPERGGEVMDWESDMAEDGMRMFRQDEFVPTLHPPPKKQG